MDHGDTSSMFGTWKYDPETEEVRRLPGTFDPITARSSQHQACNRCHEKKLKCSGDKNGCDRCAASQLRCEYTRSGSRSGRRGRKTTTRRTSDTRSRDVSPNVGSSLTPRSRAYGPPASQSPAPHFDDYLHPDDGFMMAYNSPGHLQTQQAYTTAAHVPVTTATAGPVYSSWQHVPMVPSNAPPGPYPDYGPPPPQGHPDPYQYQGYPPYDPGYWQP